MIISVNWLKKYTDISLPIDELATLIGARLVEIEEVIDLGAKYKDVVIAKVVSCEKMKDSDHLNVAKLDDGGKTPDVERDEDGFVQVVCGASNVREGLFVAWLPPKSTVPQTFGSDEPFVLDARKLRGVQSNGMIASARELDLFDEHDGILELDDNLTPGSSFAAVYELNDYLLDIENKSLTHRPDTFGILGFAREVAAIQGNAFTTPQWLNNETITLPEKDGDIEMPTISIDNPELSARYQAVVLSGADGSKKSPLLVQTYLARVGVRPISAVVDVTNYLMMLTGQPLHAFDYDKVVNAAGGNAAIHVRAGRENEPLELLDGRTIKLSTSDIVIAAGETAIGLAGAMGGASTEIDVNTKNIIVESATFNLYNLRATQMRHGIFSEAITRFTKGQPAELVAPVLANAVALFADYTGSKRASDVAEQYPGLHEPETITITAHEINAILGTTHSIEAIEEILRRVEFGVTRTNDSLQVAAPYWRSDIHILEDIAEEVGRLEGFDTIEPTLPLRSFVALAPSPFDKTRAHIRTIMTRAGANEVLTYSFVHGNLLEKAQQSPDNSYRIINSISPDLQYYRQTLTPSLLSTVHANSKKRYDSFTLYELNKTHSKSSGMTDENVPVEVDMFAAVCATSTKSDETPYYTAKRLLDFVAEKLGLTLVYEPLETESEDAIAAPFELKRTAAVSDAATDTFFGYIGEYKKSVAKRFKLPAATAGFELHTAALHEAVMALEPNYKPLSKYPSVERDVCYKVNADITYAQVLFALQVALRGSSVETTIAPLDIYKADDANTRNITFRLTFTPHEKTLSGDEVARAMDKINEFVIQDVGASVV